MNNCVHNSYNTVQKFPKLLFFNHLWIGDAYNYKCSNILKNSFLPFPLNHLLSPGHVFLFFWFLKCPVDLYIFVLECLTCGGLSLLCPFFNHSALHLAVHSVLVHKTFNSCIVFYGEGNGTLLQYSCLENP